MEPKIQGLIPLVFFTAVARTPLTPLPVVFEENHGQASREVAFLSRAAGQRVFLTRREAVIVGNDGKSVRVGFASAKAAAPVGVHRLATQSNYLIGSRPEQWRTGIPTYEKARYAQVYSGIDVVWHGNGAQIEYDFLVAAGADPRRIRLDIRGAPLALNSEGDVVAGSIRFHKPRAHQDGREIACRYRLRGQSVSFELGEYSRALPLTIDPVLSFSTFLGGNDSDSATAIVLDRAGNIYVAGITAAADFPISSGAVQQTLAKSWCGTFAPEACSNVFVTKLSPDGSRLLFSTYLGGTGNNTLSGIALDAAGNVYLTGYPGGTDFPMLTPLPGNSLSPLGPYLAKLSSDGSTLLYSTMLPLSNTRVSALAVDVGGAVYLTGYTGGLPVVNALQSRRAIALVFKTADSAESWQGLMDDLPIDLVTTIAADPVNPQTLYLGLEQGLYKSTDGGGHWTALQNGLPLERVFPKSVVADPSRPQTLYLGTLFSGVYKSTDGGASWRASGAGANRFVRMIAIDPKNQTTLFAATDVGLYKSTDAAANWHATGLMAGPNDVYFVHNVVLDPSIPSTLYAGTRNGVMKSTDGGASWTALTNGFTRSLDIMALAIDPVNPQTLYAATSGTSPYTEPLTVAHTGRRVNGLPEITMRAICL